MNRLVRGSVILAAAVVSWACGGLDTDGIDATAELVADPSVVYVSNRDSQAVFVEALNSLGQQLEGNFTLSNVGAGISVNLDTTFAPRPGVDNLPTRVRYFVKASSITSFVNSSFTVTANGESLVVPVRITPDTLSSAVLSNASPAIGDTVQLTAPAGIRFTPTTAITTPGDTSRRLANVGISADSTVLFILPGPDIIAQALRLTNVQVQFHPGVNFAVNTDAVLTTPSLPVPQPTITTVSSSTPALLDTVTISAPAPFGFTANSRVTTAGGPNQFVDVSADHTTMRIVVGAGITGLTSINNIALGGQASLGVLTMLGAVPFTSPALPAPLPTVTVSNAAPALGDTITVTAPAGFGFQSTSRVTLGGGAPNLFVDVSPNGQTLRFIIGPNSTGTFTVNNAKLGGNAALNTVTLTSAVSVSSPSAPPLAAVYSTTSPAGGAQVTATAPAAYRFRSSVSITIGGVPALVDSVSADSLNVYFVPAPGSSGTPTFSNVLLSNLLTFNLTNVASTTSVTAGALAPIAGTGAQATAPNFAPAASGQTLTIFDVGTVLPGAACPDFGCSGAKFYKFTVAAATIVDVNLNWTNNDDLGVYMWLAADCTAVSCDAADAFAAADGFGGGAGGHPENAANVTLAPGTYIFAMVTFNNPAAGPALFRMKVTTH